MRKWQNICDGCRRAIFKKKGTEETLFHTNVKEVLKKRNDDVNLVSG